MLIFATIIVAISLVLTAKFNYYDEMTHFKSSTCFISNCTSDSKNVTMVFTLNVSNIIKYTKTDWTTDPVWTNYCSNNDERIFCFYDDRNIFDSLRLFKEYFPTNGSNAIIALGFILVMMMFATMTAGVFANSKIGENQFE